MPRIRTNGMPRTTGMPPTRETRHTMRRRKATIVPSRKAPCPELGGPITHRPRRRRYTGQQVCNPSPTCRTHPADIAHDRFDPWPLIGNLLRPVCAPVNHNNNPNRRSVGVSAMQRRRSRGQRGKTTW
jgi:hypothetical protein